MAHFWVVADGHLRPGNALLDTRYHAFGATRSGGTNTPTDKRFTGQTLDASMGLYWYGSRAYDPVLGRFVQPDSVVPDYKNPQSLNRYSYVLNNPVRYTDPSGNAPWEPEDEGGGGEGGEAGGEIGPEQWAGYTDPDFPDNLSDYYFSGDVPPGVDVAENMDYAAGAGLGSVGSIGIAGLVESAASAIEFGWLVREEGDWDFKRGGHREYESYGNFSYGATGTAWGFSEEPLLRAAGVVQFLTDVKHNVVESISNVFRDEKVAPVELKPGIPGVSAPYYGDDPKDQQMIRTGVSFQNAYRRVLGR